MFKVTFFILTFVLTFHLQAAPKVAAVLAHPDDESTFAVTLYKISHEMDGDVDVIFITNGEGGYKYSLLAEPIYHKQLTDEKVGRKHLPFIRKQEALNGGKILQVRNNYFLEEPDTGYTQDPQKALSGEWNVSAIKEKLNDLMVRNQYDYVFVMLPVADTHGHHKAATILALETVKEMSGKKPVILGVKGSANKDSKTQYVALDGFPNTSAEENPIAQIDKTKKFGYNNRLDYHIITNWLIAEHKSQGTMHLDANKWDYENFYYFDMNDPARKKEVQDFFNQLNSTTPIKESNAQ